MPRPCAEWCCTGLPCPQAGCSAHGERVRSATDITGGVTLSSRLSALPALLQDTVHTVQAMKAAGKEMKGFMKVSSGGGAGAGAHRHVYAARLWRRVAVLLRSRAAHLARRDQCPCMQGHVECFAPCALIMHAYKTAVRALDAAADERPQD